MKGVANVLEDNEISIRVDNLGGHWSKIIIKIHSVDFLRYDRFKKVSNILTISNIF